jgi:hypothetical protein
MASVPARATLPGGTDGAAHDDLPYRIQPARPRPGAVGCHGIKEAAIADALHRIERCEAAAELLGPLAARLQQALDRLRQVPQDLGEAYDLIYSFIRRGGKLPVYARWIEGAGAGQ